MKGNKCQTVANNIWEGEKGLDQQFLKSRKKGKSREMQHKDAGREGKLH